MKKLILAVLLTLLNSLALAENRIETIQLNHRLASEMLPEIQALLPKQATARAFNDFIILQADGDTIKQIKQLINQLDTPLQRLKITVTRTDQLLSEQSSSRISGRVSVIDGDLSGNVSIQKGSSQNVRNNDQYFQAQGIANTPISIHMNEDIAQQEQYLIFRANGDLAIQNTTHYISIKNGFTAIARILPNHQVTIDVRPVFGHFSQRTGVIDTNNIVSTISGEEGKWILLGETSNGKNIEQYGATSYHSHEQQQQRIYIKVEQLL